MFNVRFELLDEEHYSFRNKLQNTNQETLVKGLEKTLKASFILHQRNPLYSAKCKEYNLRNNFFDCNLHEARNMFRSRKLDMPIWMENKTETVGGSMPRSLNIVDINALYNFVTGASDLYCLDPCQYVQVNTLQVSNNQNSMKSRSASIVAFPRKITKRIEKSANYNPLVMLSLIGGNIGLWLGWSVLQVMNAFISWMPSSK